MSRRIFIQGMGASALLGLGTLGGYSLLQFKKTSREGSKSPMFPGEVLGANAKVGHRLWTTQAFDLFRTPDHEEEVEVALIGSGIGCLSAGRQLRKEGIKRLRLFDLQDEPGGNSRSGENSVSAYPWGAHYLPVPPQEAIHVKELLKEIGVIEKLPPTSAGEAPSYSEYALCSTPQERLFMHGKWHEGIAPTTEIPAKELLEHERFSKLMADFRLAVGADGRRAFAIPLQLSSTDPRYTQLDSLTFAEWLSREKFQSPTLLWYADYCCRDDFGASAKHISAWAGIHYFASRKADLAGSNSLGESPILTWPRGNGEIARHLFRQTVADDSSTFQSNTLVLGVSRAPGNRLKIRSWNHQTGKLTDTLCSAVVLGVPLMIAKRLLQGELQESPTYQSLSRLSDKTIYSPWMVANITLKSKSRPAGDYLEVLNERGVPLAWDNVIYQGRGLGYVVATHQNLAAPLDGTVLTYYRPLDHLPPKEARREALALTIGDWQAQILQELRVAHPTIDHWISQLDVMVWGHAMPQPFPGFLTDPDRLALLDIKSEDLRGIAFAHSDLSQYSIFEEPFEHGIRAAARALASMRRERERT
jgi:hypothetical protein